MLNKGFHFTFWIAITAALFMTGCGENLDIPHSFPTPPPNPRSTPVTKLELKPDAELIKQFAEIAGSAKGKVGVAAVLLETGDAAYLNADEPFPMQSVYKLPIAMAVMEQVRRGEMELNAKFGVREEDMVRAGMRSPLRDANPNGGEFTIRELIRLSLVESDGTASDVLIKAAGGTINIQAFLTQIGITKIKVLNSEKEIGSDWETQYQNWAAPFEAVELLRWLHAAAENQKDGDFGETDEFDDMTAVTGYRLIINFMAESNPGAMRLKRQLPNGTAVAHKTGTSGIRNGKVGATNDIGIITLPNGNHIAIAVFVSDSPVDEKTREEAIAAVAKAAWERWNKK